MDAFILTRPHQSCGTRIEKHFLWLKNDSSTSVDEEASFMEDWALHCQFLSSRNRRTTDFYHLMTLENGIPHGCAWAVRVWFSHRMVHSDSALRPDASLLMFWHCVVKASRLAARLQLLPNRITSDSRWPCERRSLPRRPRLKRGLLTFSESPSLSSCGTISNEMKARRALCCRSAVCCNNVSYFHG